MIDRREVLIGLGAAALVPSVGLSAEPTKRWWHEIVWDFLQRHPEVTRVYDRDPGLKAAWAMTEGKTPEGMREALTKAFGDFPIWFVDDAGEVVILGVQDFPHAAWWRASGRPPKGYMQCDVRIIRMVQQGEWVDYDSPDRVIRTQWVEHDGAVDYTVSFRPD